MKKRRNNTAKNGSSPASCPESSPPVNQWSQYQTKYLPGDLVETEFGKAIITEAKQTQGTDAYAVWPLPEWKWRRESWGWSPVKYAWYPLDELKLLEKGPASKLRPDDH